MLDGDPKLYVFLTVVFLWDAWLELHGLKSCCSNKLLIFVQFTL